MTTNQTAPNCPSCGHNRDMFKKDDGSWLCHGTHRHRPPCKTCGGNSNVQVLGSWLCDACVDKIDKRIEEVHRAMDDGIITNERELLAFFYPTRKPYKPSQKVGSFCDKKPSETPMAELIEKARSRGQSCWLTDDSELHPETGCPSSGDWLTVATNGRARWIACSQCHATWSCPNTKVCDPVNPKEPND